MITQREEKWTPLGPKLLILLKWKRRSRSESVSISSHNSRRVRNGERSLFYSPFTRSPETLGRTREPISQSGGQEACLFALSVTSPERWSQSSDSHAQRTCAYSPGRPHNAHAPGPRDKSDSESGEDRRKPGPRERRNPNSFSLKFLLPLQNFLSSLSRPAAFPRIRIPGLRLNRLARQDGPTIPRQDYCSTKSKLNLNGYCITRMDKVKDPTKRTAPPIQISTF